jgi:uncharacterized membrane protein
MSGRAKRFARDVAVGVAVAAVLRAAAALLRSTRLASMVGPGVCLGRDGLTYIGEPED